MLIFGSRDPRVPAKFLHETFSGIQGSNKVAALGD